MCVAVCAAVCAAVCVAVCAAMFVAVCVARIDNFVVQIISVRYLQKKCYGTN